MFDVIVVGARCGGAPLAMNLARSGHRVLAVDRNHFPSDTLSTHCLTGDSMMRLVNWGVMPRLIQSGCRPVHAVQFTSGEFQKRVELPAGAFALNPRRTVLDTVLVEAARESGAEVREGITFSKVLRDESGAVCGFEGHDEAGNPVREEARVVVGADGRNSAVAKAVGAEEYGTLPGLTCGWYSYFADFDADNTEVWFAPGHALFVFPTNDGLTCLGAEFDINRFESLRGDIEQTIADAFGLYPSLAERLSRARRVEAWQGMRAPTWYYRKPFGAGWALIGDAGYLKDPVLGQGINDAFRDADALAIALDDVLAGRRGFDEAMGAFQQERDAATAMMCQVNYEVSKLQVAPAMVAMLTSGIEANLAAPA